MKILFFGTPAFAVPFLRALDDARDIEVLAAVSQPDRPAGRGNALGPTPVKAFAESRGLAVYQPDRLKDPETLERLRSYGADAFVVVAYGKLLPSALLAAPRLGCINVHPSLLPAYRGPSPLQAAIADGAPETGVSIMLLDEGMDTGPILAQTRLSLDTDETIDTLEKKVHAFGPSLLVETLIRYGAGQVEPVPQGEATTPVTRLLEKEDGRTDWTRPLAEIDRKARAYRSWPGAWNVWTRGGKPVRLSWLAMRPADFRADKPAGTVTGQDGRLYVEAADGTMEILRVKPEGRGALNAADFLRGYSDIDAATLA